MIKTAMIVAAMSALLGTAQADVCVPVDGMVPCDKSATNSRFNRSCRTTFDGGLVNYISPNAFLVIPRQAADPSELYEVHFAGFNVDECRNAFEGDCYTVTQAGDLLIGSLSNVSGTTQRVGLTRITDETEDDSAVCEQGLTVEF